MGLQALTYLQKDYHFMVIDLIKVFELLKGQLFKEKSEIREPLLFSM